MKEVVNSQKFAIYDDVMNKEDFTAVWDYVQNEEYTFTHMHKWMKVWRVGDGFPLGGVSYNPANAPFGNGMDLAWNYLRQIAEKHQDILGVQNKDWEEISLRSYIYGRGTKLSWHNDAGYTGAIVFYTHPRWSCTWGGELLIAEIKKGTEHDVGGQLDHHWRDTVVNKWGVGQFIVPKPNRAVVTSQHIWHTINRVDEDAGDYTRCSIVCFFHNKKHDIQLEDPLVKLT